MSDTLCPMPPCPHAPLVSSWPYRMLSRMLRAKRIGSCCTRLLSTTPTDVTDIHTGPTGLENMNLWYQVGRGHPMAYHGTGWPHRIELSSVYHVTGISSGQTVRSLWDFSGDHPKTSHIFSCFCIFRHPSALPASVAKFANDIATQSDSYFCRRDALFPFISGSRGMSQYPATIQTCSGGASGNGTIGGSG